MRIFCKSSFIFFVGAASMRSVLARENVHFKKKTKEKAEPRVRGIRKFPRPAV